MSEAYVLQNRWRLEGNSLYYYGLRNRDKLFHNRVRLSKKQVALVVALPKELDAREKKTLGSLLGEQIVPLSQLRKTPSRLREAAFCAACCANDFLIPGLEFDEEGRCPLCQTEGDVTHLRSVVPLVEELPRAKHSRFDVALFYTGGKDSTYLLYQLSKRMGLRVLALTWEIPFQSDSAKRSIENAKKRLPNVEFLSRSVAQDDLKTVYRTLYELSGNTCACPSLAYLLFYPDLVAERVPYFLVGNEPVQMLGLYYNHMAPPLAYTVGDKRWLSALIDLGRLLTLRPPLRRGQLQTLLTMKQLAKGDHPLKKLAGYDNALVSNVVTAIHQVPAFLPPLRRSIRASSRTGRIPAFVHLDFDRLEGGAYDWNRVKELLVKECGWVPPEEEQKGLHTSCQIEKCKDYSQFRRFYECRSKMIPFSALEIALASRRCGRSREEILYEMEHVLGFCTEELPECAIMRRFLEEEP